MTNEYNLLILAPQLFINDLQDLANHKNDTGMLTKVLSLEQIYKEYSGRDEAEKVKACLFHAHLQYGIKYAMLVGDEDKFPIRFTKWTWQPTPNVDERPVDKPSFYTLYVSTDQYYTALYRPDGSFDNWDANQDGVFGETFLSGYTTPIEVNPDKVHMIPQIAVGRVPASSNSEVKNYVSKVINYEKQDFSISGWLNNLLVVLGFNPSTETGKTGTPYDLADGNWNLISKMFKVHTFGFNPGNETPDPDKINEHIDNGVGFVIYHGHGAMEKWTINWSPNPIVNYSRDDVLGSIQDKKKGLDNPNKLPVIFAESCDTGQFGGLPPLTGYTDINGIGHNGVYKNEVFASTPPQPACIQTDPAHMSESMAEAMTVMKTTGAIGYVGATITSGSPDENMLYFFLKALQDGHWTLGDTWKKMMEQYYQNYIPPDPNTRALAVDAALIMPWRYCLFGDPSLRLRGVKNAHLSPEDIEIHINIEAIREFLDRIDPARKQSFALKAYR
jgi:hypothetical protein